MEIREYDKLHKLEESNWYFVSRRLFFSKIFGKYVPKRSNMRILDLGCGSGQMFKMLGKYGKVLGVEPSFYMLRLAPDAAFRVCSDGVRLPFKDGTFDMITLFGVLEHIDDDTGVLKELKRVSRKNGLVFIEVPAYQFLWSSHDEALHHKRRYTKKSLAKKLTKMGFRVKKSGYIFGAILPAVIALRTLKRLFGKDEIKTDGVENLPPLLEKLLINVNKIESGTSMLLPFGVSVVALAEKPSEPSK